MNGEVVFCVAPHVPFGPSPNSTRHPSTLIPPVPCFKTFAATVPHSGFRATHIGSHAGLSAVPQPSHCFAASVAGAVMSIVAGPLPTAESKPAPPCVFAGRQFSFLPTTSRSAPAALSIALLLRVATVNEIRLAAVDSVIVAVMADTKAVCCVVSKLWKVFDWLNVMRLKSSVSAAHSASVSALLEDFVFPSQVIRASPALSVAAVLSLCDSLAAHRAESNIERWLPADSARPFNSATTAFLRAIGLPAKMGRTSLNSTVTPDAFDELLSRLARCRAVTRTESQAGVCWPASGDSLWNITPAVGAFSE